MSGVSDNSWIESMTGPTIGRDDEQGPLGAGFPPEFRVPPYAAGPRSGPAGGGAGVPSHGLNVPVCRDISYGLAKDAEDLERIGEDADVSVRRILDVWDGDDAEKFRVQWLRSHRELDEATTSLKTLRQVLDLAVDDQEAASRH